MGMERYMRDTITHWPITGHNGFSGATFGAPVVMRARWEDRAEQFVNDLGEENVSNAVVFLPSDVALGDYLALGDHSSVTDPTELTGAYRIRHYNKMRDLRNLSTERKAFL